MAVIKDNTGNHLASINDARTGDNKVHDVKIEVTDTTIDVFIDAVKVLSWTGTIDKTYSGLGFSAATGFASNLHIIDDVTIKGYHKRISSSTTPITRVNSISPINVTNGTARAALPLPATVTVTLDNGTEASCNVTWDNGDPEYNPSPETAASYTFTGTLSCPGDMSNPNNLKAAVVVNVAAAEGDPSENIVIWPEEKQNVPSQWPWNIEFSQEVDYNTATKDNITVQDKNNNPITVEISSGSNSKLVTVNPPEGGYTPGETYYLNIANLESRSGQPLKQAVRMKFNIAEK